MRAIYAYLLLYAMRKVVKLYKAEHGEHNLVAQRFYLVYMEPLRLADNLQLLAELRGGDGRLYVLRQLCKPLLYLLMDVVFHMSLVYARSIKPPCVPRVPGYRLPP